MNLNDANQASIPNLNYIPEFQSHGKKANPGYMSSFPIAQANLLAVLLHQLKRFCINDSSTTATFHLESVSVAI